MIIQSGFLSEGLFGQIFNWMLDVLPHVQSSGWMPEWRIRTKNYGESPSFNIFPSIIRTTYEPDKTDSTVISLESLQETHRKDLPEDFERASRLWHAYFRFTDDVYEQLAKFCTRNFESGTVLGVHYRCTDKNYDVSQTNPITHEEFLLALDDFLKNQPPIRTIFVATDDHHFVSAIAAFSRDRYEILHHSQTRAQDDVPLFNKHAVFENEPFAKSAILDCLTLSRCDQVFSRTSALSAFAKVLNPGVESYRVTSCKPDWFPMSRIPRYLGHSAEVQALLRRLQKGDWSERTPV